MKNRPLPRGCALRRLLCAFVLALSLAARDAQAELLPAERTANWDDAGIPGGIPAYPVGVNVTSHGAVGDGVTDDTAAFEDAIAACSPGEAVYVPDGTYRLTDTITIDKGVALRGQSRLGTVLAIDHSGDALYLGTYSGLSGEIVLTDGLARGSTEVTAASVTGSFVAGNLIEITQDNDPDVYQDGSHGYQSWTDRQTAMMNEIVSVSGTDITFKHPLLLEFSDTANPKIRAQTPVYRAGVETLTIDRIVDDSGGTGNNIVLLAAMQCWVKDIWSEKTYERHITLNRSLQCEIRGNVLNDTWLDGGGQGYGVAVENRSTLTLVEDNSASGLRHSYVVQAGATGNVIAYNFSRAPYSSECSSCLFADLLAHGSLGNYTLFEGNKGAQLYFDNIHGSNPYTTAFRNYVARPKSSYPGIDVAKTSKWCSLIGNVVGNLSVSGEAIDIATEVAATTIVTGNLDGNHGLVDWDPAYDTTLPDSFYLGAKPAFFGSKPWPLFGPGIGVLDTLPAEDRWYALSGTTAPFEAPVATTNSGYLDALLSPSLYYDCEDRSTGVLHDLTVNRVNGTLAGPAFESGGVGGTQALRFDGSNDKVVIPDGAAVDFKTGLTLATWVRLDTTAGTQCLVGKNNAYYLSVYSSGSGARVRVGLRIAGAWAIYQSPSTATIPANTWTHVAASYDGTEIAVYINGALVGSSATSGNVTTGGSDVELGTIWGGSRLDGALDDVALFDHGLDAAAVALLHSGEWLQPLLPDPVARYDFEEGSGASAVDTGPHGLDGTITGAIHDGDSVVGDHSLLFDGTDDYVSIADNTHLDADDALTIAAWVKMNDIASSQCVVGKNSAYYLYLYPGTYGLRLRVGLRIGASWVLYTSPNTSSKSVPANAWTHLAATYDGAHIRCYLDGVDIGSAATTGQIDNSNKVVELGRLWNGYHFDGLMDDVRIFDTALQPEEIEILAE